MPKTLVNFNGNVKWPAGSIAELIGQSKNESAPVKADGSHWADFHSRRKSRGLTSQAGALNTGYAISFALSLKAR